MFVILASSSVRLSPHSERSVLLSCRPQIAAPTLPVAIMDGGYMAKLKSEGDGNKKKHYFKQGSVELPVNDGWDTRGC